MTRTLALLVAIAAPIVPLIGCTADTGPIAASDAPPAPPRPAVFDTWTRSGGNRLVIHGDADATGIEIYSDHGIGSAVVTLTDGDWPRALTVNVHTRLLEKFEVETADGKKAAIEVKSYGDHSVLQSPPRQPDDPLYMPVKIVDRALPPKQDPLPLRDPKGHFAITLPAALFAAHPDWIKLTWIDVYRN